MATNHQYAALMISDVQNDFCTKGGKIYDRNVTDPSGMATLVRAIGSLAAAARESGVPVIYIQNMHLTNAADLAAANLQYRPGNLSGTFDDISCLAGSWGYQVVDEIRPLPGDITIDKSAFNCLQGSLIPKVLHAREVKTVYLTGVSTHSGILATTFGLNDYGYEFFVVRECVGGYDAELHEAAMKILHRRTIGQEEARARWRTSGQASTRA